MARRADEFQSKDKRKLPIFIQSELDDYGLTCVEFRVYARIARRAGTNGGHVESVPNMAKAFGVKDKTVRRALAVLTAAKLVDEKSRPGHTNLYILNDQELWLPTTELDRIREGVCGRKSNSATLDTRDRGKENDPGHEGPGGLDTRDRPPWTPGTDEVYPDQGTPIKVLPLTPQPLPRLPGSDDELKDRSEQFHYTALKDPNFFGYDIVAEMTPMFPTLNVDHLFQQWKGRRIVARGIGKRPRAKSTKQEYAQDFQNFLDSCVEVRQNGNGHKPAEEYRGPSRNTEPEEARKRREGCPDCFGTKTKRFTQVIEGVERTVSVPCKHENSQC